MDNLPSTPPTTFAAPIPAEATPVGTDLLRWTLLDALDRARTGDLDALVEASQVAVVLDHAIASGADLPTHWRASASTASGQSPVGIYLDSAGTYFVTGAGEAEDQMVVFEEDDQLGFVFAAAPTPPRPHTTRFPRPKTGRCRPHRNSVGELIRDQRIPVAGPSTLGDGTLRAGLNNPTESHKVAAKMALRAGRFNHAVFWLIYDTPGGLADHEMEHILDRSHQSLSATRNALMNKGYIEASGEIRTTDFGNDAAVWVPTDWAVQRVRRGLEARAT